MLKSNRTSAGARRMSLLAATAGASLGFAACSSGPDYNGAAIDIIEGDLAELIGVEPVDPTCVVPDDDVELVDGDTFPCTATTADGATINYEATLDGTDRIDVLAINVATPEALSDFERILTETVSEQAGFAIGAEFADCGEETIVIEASTVLACALTDPENGDVYDVELTEITMNADLEINFQYEVAETPRS